MPTLVDAMPRSSRTPASQGAIACAHCDLPVPPGLVDSAEERQFCCAACRTAYGVIHAGGLEAFYDVRRRFGAPEARALDGAGPGRYSHFDDASFLARHAVTGADGVCAAELFAPAMHCAACVWLLERLPRLQPGVRSVRADLGRSLVRVEWNPGEVSLSRIAGLAHSLGYALRPTGGADARAERRAQDRAMLVRIGVAGAIAGNVMLASFALYAAGAGRAGGAAGAMDPAFRAMFRWLTLALGLVSIAWPGASFFRGAWAALRARSPHMDVPIALGLSVGAVWGVVCTVRGAGETYFDTLTVLVFLLLVGRWIQRQQQRRAADALESLGSLAPTRARLVGEDGVALDAPLELVRRGAIVECLPGDTIPVDGVVTRGESEADEALLTGESEPVPLREGSRAHAGTTNLSGVIRVLVEAAGEATRAGAIERLVRECAQRKAPIVRLADRVAAIFVWAVVGLSLLTLGVWLRIDPSRAVDHATALLIVTCPCALGMATPLAITTAIGRAARRGILIKGGEALEALARPGRLILDKTGTITEGAPTVSLWRGSDSARTLVGALEAECPTHPVARALADMARSEDGSGPRARAESVHHRLGAGVEGTVGGTRVRVGAAAFVRESSVAGPGFDADAFVLECEGAGVTPVLVGVEGVLVAGAGVGDRPRTDAAESIAALRSMGWTVGVLSGDRRGVVERVARSVGIEPTDTRAGASPEDKAAHIGSLVLAAGAGPVVMVGDGVNDAAALARATVGVAVHAGAEASLRAADIHLSREGLAPLVELVDGARRTMALIRATLGVSLLYNGVCVALAMGGLLSPIVAAVLMPMSSLTILTMTCRAKLFPTSRVAPTEGGRRWR